MHMGAATRIDRTKISILTQSLFGWQHRFLPQKSADWVEPLLSLRKKGANGFPSRLVASLNQFVSSPCASPTEDIPSIQGTHTLTETVCPLVTAVVRLKSSFHRLFDSPGWPHASDV